MSDQRPLAVYTDTDDLNPAAGVDLLSGNGFRVEVCQTRDPDRIAEAAAGASALLVGYAPIDRELLDRLPDLRIIALLSRGYDNVDVAAATERGIWVCTVADLASEEVGTHAWTLSLALLRQLPYFAGCGTVHGWIDRPPTLPRRLSEVTVGVLGLGSTGRAYAELAAPAAARVLAHDVSRGPDRPDVPGVQIVDFWTVIEEADVLSLHLPLTEKTRGIIDAEAIARMRDDAYLVNVARGALLDPAALLDALDHHRLAGAALDVFDTEPPAADDPLLAHPRVLTTPHVAYLSTTTESGYITAQANNVLAWHDEGRPTDPINHIAGMPC
ncbi:C-terminal binding protein [Gordonia insulae]|uniref:Glycerate dehydrogenase n=1 Tax=Gordonia insulae TaxID=2420509 RepID=A0A3G8JJ95_9ACTN|nr:C-terminal binding protein [Gordonia insulae]AZG44685.1 Glycerate dehydrogenase [Gordonia insulae]